MRKIRTCSFIASIALLAAAGAVLPTVAGSPQDETNAPAEPELHAVARGDLVLRVQRDGRIDSASRIKVRIEPEAYTGPLELTEVLAHGGQVKEGDTLFRLDATRIDKALKAARLALTRAEQDLDFARQEQGILAESNQIRIERSEAAQTAAEHAFEIFDKYNGEKMLRSAELTLMQREFSLTDQKEELAQLEKMYEGTSLATETKEIVLERNRRSVKMSEEWLKFVHNDLIVTREYTYPDRKVAVENDLRWRSLELDHAKANVRMAEARKQNAVEAAARTLEDAREKLEKLDADKALLTVSAAASGVLTPITLKVGDTVNRRQVMAEIVDASRLSVNFSATPEDLRALAEGSSVRVTFPAYGEVDLAGSIAEIAAVGTAAGASTSFPVKVTLNESDPLVRIGLNCKIGAEKTIPNVVIVPPQTVHEKDGRTICYVWTGTAAEEREVTIGAGNSEWVQIVAGLAVGDQVLLKEPK